jgi:trigger factor
MNITKKEIDNLNALVRVEIEEKDYSDKVKGILNNYRKTANIPGFRKGHVPMGMIQKQYGKAVLIDEVNKILQDSLHKYLVEEKLEVLGNPLPRNDEEIDWDASDFTFEFELGLAPQFEVDVKGKKAITHYKIIADDTMVDNQITSIRKQFGKLISKKVVEEGDEITGTFRSEEKDIDKETSISLDIIKGKRQQKALLGAQVGDVVQLKTKGLFMDDHQNQTYLGVSHDDAHGLDVEVTFEIKEVNKREMAEMNQDLFDKIFGKDAVANEKEFKTRIKEDAEKQFVQHSDQKLMDDAVESLISNTKFDLPGEFLQKWIMNTGEKPMTEAEAVEEFEKSEKGLRYQLIEGKIIADNDLQVTFDELKDYTKKMIRFQMAQYGQTNPSDEELDGIVARIMSNQDEVKRINDQLKSQKLLQFIKDNAKLNIKEITYDKFLKEAYG